MTADLLVIVPSRGRPENITRLWEAWQATATGAADLLVCLDLDDPVADEYTAAPYAHVLWSWTTRNGFAPRLTAEAVHYAQHYYALASWGDDHVPRTKGWDAALLDALRDMGTGFAYGDDGFQGPNIPTACAMTSDIVTTLGWMTPPGLAHLYVDNVWKDMGKAIDRLAYLPDVLIEHLHPATGKVEWDDLTRDANTGDAYTADLAAYERWKLTDMEADVDKLKALL